MSRAVFEASSTHEAHLAPTLPGAAGPLGTTYQISGHSSSESEGLGVRAGSESAPSQARQASRRERFKLQRVAVKFLQGTKNPKGKRWRVQGCMSSMISGAQGVSVLKHAETGHAHYGNLQRCGSVHTCPVCAARVSEVRTAEVAAAMTVHTMAGGTALMVTWTHSHTRSDRLLELVKGQRKALAMMTSWRAFKAISARLGIVGTIRAREVTYGDSSGWHPHLHDLWLIRSEVPLDAIEKAEFLQKLKVDLFPLWLKACQKSGLPLPSLEHGVAVSHALSPAEYLAKFGRDTKWGTSREMTKSHIKNGREGRYTPWDLLRGVGHLSESRARELWLEYATAMHGARQLTWSRGLKAAMCIADLSDEEIAEGGDDLVSLVALISPEEWRLVLKAHARATVLELAESGGRAAVSAFLGALSPDG